MNDLKTRQPEHKRHNTTLWVFMAIILYFLITEHWAHIVPYLPWLLLLACPLMHVFMHGGHSQGHGAHTGHDAQISHGQGSADENDRDQGAR